MEIFVDNNPRHLRLGIQTQRENIYDDIFIKCYHWCPKVAKSFSIVKYEEVESDIYQKSRGLVAVYIDVAYYNTKREGKYPIIRNREDALKRYDKIFSQYQRDYSGSGSFGFDWPTLLSNRPETHWEMRMLLEKFIYTNREE